jgi:hypothetical protein
VAQTETTASAARNVQMAANRAALWAIVIHASFVGRRG